MNCPICFELIKHSCVGSCMHHFCYNCLIKWCRMGGNKCPVCKQIIYEIRKDREFDNVNNPIDNDNICEYTKKICIHFNNNIPPGITLMNNNGPGVKIKKLKTNELCDQNGLKLNDTILFLNNIPCINHIDCIDIINDMYKSNKPIMFEILILKK